MGNKGDKLTSNTVISAELLIEKLSSIEGVSSKKMFGGHGVFHDKKMFCIVDSKGQYFLRVDDSCREEFESHGAHQHSKMPYYSIPEKVVKDQNQLITWAKRSIEISK